MAPRIALAKLVAQRLPDLDDVVTAISAGEIHVDGAIITNPRANVASDAAVVFAPRRALKGEQKLGAALDAFETPVVLEGRVALDVGASTGGFTTELLNRGCCKVYAVDVGHGQLRGTLRQDPRVVNLEATNAADLTGALIPDEIEVVTVDVSYTPLAVIVPQITGRVHFANGAVLLALVKPMFELQLGELPTTEEQFDDALLRATDGITSVGWTVEETITSPLTGNQGAIEEWVREDRAMSWTEVDEGWGRKAVDWAYLLEVQMWPEYVTMLDACGAAEGTAILDVACGSGYALWIARDRGAVVSGIDASPRLIKVALARTPDGDIRAGDMFDLPWPDASFDVVTAFRGIWGGCEDALAEVVRVCRPGGRVGLSFWGNPKRMAAYPLFKLFGQVEDHDYAHAKEMSNIAWKGVAEQMMRDAGLEPGTRWLKSVPLAFPDPDLTVRGFSSSGPAYLAQQKMGEEAFAAAAREAAEQLAVPDAGVRFDFEVQFLVGVKPG